MKRTAICNFSTLYIVGTALTLGAAGGMGAAPGAQPGTSYPANRQSTQDGPTPSATGASAQLAAALARLAAAERVCKILHDRETGAPRAHESVEHTYRWSKRRMAAQIEVEHIKPGGGDGGIAAIERHVQWMREWSKEVTEANAKGAFSTFDVASSEYYVAEAEDILARAKTK